MPPGTEPITGTNSQFTPSLRSPLPDFMNKQFEAPQLQIGTADLSKVDPQYRNIFRQFNQGIEALKGQAQAATTQANRSRDVLSNQLLRGTQAAEQERIRSTGAARQSADEAQTRARQRIRAVGGAPSSASLELANRIDRDTLQNIGQIGERFSGRRGELEDRALAGLTDIESNLQNTINRILGDATLTLRERDAMIRSEQERAASRAAQAAMMGMYAGGAGGRGGVGGGQGQGEGMPVDERAINEYSSYAAQLRNNPVTQLSSALGFGQLRPGVDPNEQAKLLQLSQMAGLGSPLETRTGGGWDFNPMAARMNLQARNMMDPATAQNRFNQLYR